MNEDMGGMKVACLVVVAALLTLVFLLLIGGLMVLWQPLPRLPIL